MKNFNRPRIIFAAAATAACLAAGPLQSANALHGNQRPTAPIAVVPQMEALDRGLTAVNTSNGVFLSWRLLASEATGTTPTGVAGPSFEVKRDGAKIATVTDSTNFVDSEGTADSKYAVTPVTGNLPGADSQEVSAAAQGYLNVPLQKPADGVTPNGEAYTYTPHDTSVSDVDGDGAYELIVKWDPSNAKDVSIRGYTGEVYIDTYKIDGTLLNRISLGKNIRAGSHYTQFLAYDFDGDGRSELMLKTAPGTKTTAYGSDGSASTDQYISLPQRDVDAGVTHEDDYRLSNQDFRDHLTRMFLGWQDREEVTSGQWPATLEDAWGIPVTHQYPLNQQSAEELTNYFIDVYAPARSTRNELWNYQGFIINGPEYLTVFDGATGKELDTVDYQPARGDDGLLWGDYSGTRIEPANRVDRFLSGVAYLDGNKPSAVFARGYYTRTAMAAYSWDGKQLKENWTVDSGHVPMSNPFNDSPHGRDGTDPTYGGITNQGFHSLSAADVDGDGKHEIVYGSVTIDDDGSVLYNSKAVLPEGSGAPGELAKLGHGDALHVTDIDPARPGLEILTVHENGKKAPYGIALRDAATGEVIKGEYTGSDIQRGIIGDVRKDVAGMEIWSHKLPSTAQMSGLLSAQGERIENGAKTVNQTIRWAADLTSQLYTVAGDQVAVIDDWQRGRLLTADGTRVNEGTTGKASLIADILGDWREELLVPGADGTSLRIYVSTEVTNHKLPTLMHDKQYRAEVARQQTAYNQPSYTSYYLASDMDFAKYPLSGTEVRPSAPLFKDRPGTDHDEVQVSKTAGIDWYIDGEKVTTANGKVPTTGPVTVTAVPRPWHRFPAGAQTQWNLGPSSPQ